MLTTKINSNGVREYYRDAQLVAVAMGNLNHAPFTQYYCLPEIFEPDRCTTFVDQEKLQILAATGTTWKFPNG